MAGVLRSGWRHARGVRAAAGAGLLLLLFAGAASAQTANDATSWQGWYFGGHVGYGRGSGTAINGDVAPSSFGYGFGGQFGGVQLGYNRAGPSGLVVGVEADITFPNYYSGDAALFSASRPAYDLAESFDYASSLRARLGLARGDWLFYGTGGFAFASTHVYKTVQALDEDRSRPAVRTGWAAGLGAEYAFERNWTGRLELLYQQFGSAAVAIDGGVRASSTLDLLTLRAGLNRRFDWDRLDLPAVNPGRVRNASAIDWEIHGQTTYVHQGYPSFSAAYSGPNSLSPFRQARETWTSSAFLAVRLWDGLELYYNPELLQGFGLSGTNGLAGFSNGEAQKSDFLFPHYNTSRLFLRQTFGLGGERETVASDYGQMAGQRDIARLTFQVGKFAVHDAFDTNAYAQDSRVDFLNWSIWAAGAFDYAADKVGLTWGGYAELNQPLWALRTGYFLIGDKPNSNTFDANVFRRGLYTTELEMRFSLFDRPGKLRLNGWVYNANSGSFRTAVDLVIADPTLDINDAIVATRTGRSKYGYVVNLEQSLTEDVGLFGRWSWNNGKTEMTAFSDINASLSGGLSIKGNRWGRPDDVVGLAGVVNALSADYRDYLARGGLGILVGDGALNYGTERIFEGYYAFNIATATSLTFDYQFVRNPAYNVDRGPVSIFSGRVHAAF